MLSLRLKKINYALHHRRLISALFRYHVLGASEHLSVLRQKFDVVVDIGANRGQFALIARIVCPDAKIISFEPLIGPFKIMEKIFKNDKLVTLIHAAVGEATEIKHINISARDDSSSLLPISDTQVATFPGTESVGIVNVNVAPLGVLIDLHLIRGKSLLKVDVQGFELHVLRGVGQDITRFEQIYCECSFIELYDGQALAQEIFDYLREFGFKLIGVYNLAYKKPDGKCVQADFLFSRN